MEEVHFTGEFIKLGQALKLAGLVYNGAESKVKLIPEEVLSYTAVK